MRIVIDLQGAQTESRFRGIGRYSMALADSIARNAGEHEVFIALNADYAGIPEVRKMFAGVLPPARIREFSTFTRTGWPQPENGPRRLASELAWEAAIEGLDPDIVLVSSLFEGAEGGALTSVARFSQVPFAVVLYDLIPLLNQDAYLGADWARDWYMDKIEALKRARLLLSISEHARQEALESLPLDPEKVVNMSSAISPRFKPVKIGASELTRLKESFGIDGDFVMYSGAMEPRKNAERLVKAFAILGDDLLANTQLVIAGKITPADMDRFRALAAELGISDRVRYTGYITDDDLMLLYSAARLFVFPSLHEGFGLPALEAMACGAPTIGSKTTSVPEVVGRADALFDPLNVVDIARAMRRALTNEAYLKSLREHARQQAAAFSWDKTGRTAIAAMEAVVGARSRSTSDNQWQRHQASAGKRYQRLLARLKQSGASSLDPDDLRHLASLIARATYDNSVVAMQGELPERLKWRVEGPFDSTYSLAVVNRNLALALDALGHDVALHSTEGPGDFQPSSEFLSSNPGVARLHGRESSLPPMDADVTSRLLYPPRVKDMQSRVNTLHLYAWEESAFPAEWVATFNDSLQGISCLSSHVAKIMVDNGVSVPLTVGGCGVDHWLEVERDPGFRAPGKSYKFLHVSSCFPRKGVQSLLQAFGEAFSANDDVTLVIKTFSNPHNEVHAWLEACRAERSDYPDVIVMEGDIPDGSLKALYGQCNALVAPSKAEGFGLPMAEAMLEGLPVITTAWGGQLDFCNPDTAWLVDYTFVPARTHFNLSNSMWAEPNIGGLATAMREVHDADPALIQQRVANARAVLMRTFTWRETARRVESDVRAFARSPELQEPRVGWITTWNSRCGIATYSAQLVSGFGKGVTLLAAHEPELVSEDAGNVHRCWSKGEGDRLEQLSAQIEQSGLQALVIQFQYAFFDFPEFARFLKTQKALGRTLVLEMHSTRDAAENPRKQLSMLAEAMRLCDRVLVHSISDMNRLKDLGVVDNAALFPHGVMAVPDAHVTVQQGPFRIATYGFFLPHKGLTEVIDAMAILANAGENIVLTMVNAEFPDPVSAHHIAEARLMIARHGLQSHVTLVTDFLEDSESISHLRNADLILYAYQETGESASGAVRYGLAAGRPVAVTPNPIFEDVDGVVHKLPGFGAPDVAAGIKDLHDKILSRDPGISEVQRAAENWRKLHAYPALAARLRSLLNQLHSGNKAAPLTPYRSPQVAEQ